MFSHNVWKPYNNRSKNLEREELCLALLEKIQIDQKTHHSKSPPSPHRAHTTSLSSASKSQSSPLRPTGSITTPFGDSPPPPPPSIAAATSIRQPSAVWDLARRGYGIEVEGAEEVEFGSRWKGSGIYMGFDVSHRHNILRKVQHFRLYSLHSKL